VGVEARPSSPFFSKAPDDEIRSDTIRLGERGNVLLLERWRDGVGSRVVLQDKRRHLDGELTLAR
jgi:hypothetical protein